MTAYKDSNSTNDYQTTGPIVAYRMETSLVLYLIPWNMFFNIEPGPSSLSNSCILLLKLKNDDVDGINHGNFCRMPHEAMSILTNDQTQLLCHLACFLWCILFLRWHWAVHETSSSPFAQFDLILGWTTWKWLWATWNYNEMLKQPICERIGHGWRFHALHWDSNKNDPCFHH